ncbi:MAG: hypothetical protein L6V93_23200 [Clostridiales bacterium]|nr:MAG: hypothetical protein L6V93_23200 [Clostridiales bacterium]
MLEGERLVCDASNLGADISFVVIKDGYSGKKFRSAKKIYTFDEKLFFADEKNTVNSQGILAVAKKSKETKRRIFLRQKNGCLSRRRFRPRKYGHNHQNVRCGRRGRGGDFQKLALMFFNPKVVRSTMASIFNVNLIFLTIIASKKLKKMTDFCLIGTYLGASIFLILIFAKMCYNYR